MGGPPISKRAASWLTARFRRPGTQTDDHNLLWSQGPTPAFAHKIREYYSIVLTTLSILGPLTVAHRRSSRLCAERCKACGMSWVRQEAPARARGALRIAGMPRPGVPFCRRERWALCDLLSELGPDVPTLCAGWTSADLAAHLYVRDRRLDTMPGNVIKVPPFAGWTRRVQDNARDMLRWEALLSRVRSGPPAPVKPFDRLFNTIEFFVHHEDVRRAQPGWTARVLAPNDDGSLWRQLASMRFGYVLSSRVSRHAPAAARLEAPGREPILLTKSGQGTVVRGPVGEVTLWLSGRKEVAQVDVASQ